jgi:acetylornithine/N-succinyldiaminopimelate aminotransferase
MGIYFKDELSKLKEKHSIIKEIRGLGLMIGIELNKNISKEINKKLFEKGYLIGSIGENVIRMLPPLIINKEDIDNFINDLNTILYDIS